MSVRVTDYHPVFADPRYYCGPGPAIITDEQGRLTVAFRRVRSWLEEDRSGHWHPATESCLTHSTDGGRHWSPVQVFGAGGQCPNLRRLRSGRWIHHTHRMELIHEEIEQRIFGDDHQRPQPWPGVPSGTLVQHSDNEGLHWSEPVLLSGVPGLTPRHASTGLPVAVRGNLLETASGRLLVSAYRGGDTNTAYLFCSDDGGEHFAYAGVIAEDHNETCLHETAGGRLLAFMRRWSDATWLSRSHSDDGGATWSEPTAVCKGYPACAVTLPSQRILLVYGYRFDDGYGTRARVLSPDGEWVDDEEILLRTDGAGADLGYPDATRLPDGRIGVVYYHTRQHAAERPNRAPRYIELCLLEDAA